MNKLFVFFAGMMLFLQQFGFSQYVSQTNTENFDGNTISFTSSPSNAWKKDTNFYKSYPNAYLGEVPKIIGGVSYLVSPSYNFTTDMLGFVRLRFHHICKISPRDTAWIEYKLSSNNQWKSVPMSCYKGNLAAISSNGILTGFSAASYPQWLPGDSLVFPSQSWWKAEEFNLSLIMSYETVEIRFVLKRGKVDGTQIAYGWLIDSVELFASQREWINPFVQLHATCPHGDQNTIGPFPVSATMRTNTSQKLMQPYLGYAATLASVTTVDSLPMLAYSGDTLWRAVLPMFSVGTVVKYWITAIDSFGNSTTVRDTFTVTRPDASLYPNSAGLDKFITPNAANPVLGGVSQPVTVQLRNKGYVDLTSATIHWSVNSVLKKDTNWTGVLPWDFTQTIYLGDYIPTTGQFDTIVAWVSSPNGVVDAVTNDDTIRIISFACNGNTAGNYLCGTGTTIPDWNSFLSLLRNCPPVGDVTLQFVSGTYSQTLDLTNMNNLMNGYALTLTSKAGVADSVRINPTGNGITLINSSNIIIKNLWIDKTSGYGISISETTPCDNVLIRDCKITFNGTAGTSIYRNETAVTVPLNNLRVIHNTIIGGNSGIHIGGGGTTRGTNNVCDSNSVTNIYAEGIYSSSLGFNSISHNTVVSNTTVGSTWDGIRCNGNSGDVIGNHIRMRVATNNSSRTTVLGLTAHNNSSSDVSLPPSLVANNEMIVLANGTGTYANICVSLSQARVKFLYNSFYSTGSRSCYGVYLGITSSGECKYNNIVMNGTNAFQSPLSMDGTYSTAWDIDHNNLYSPSIVYSQNPQDYTSIAAMQTLVTTDKHSFRVLPAYLDNTTDLKQVNYNGFVLTTDTTVVKNEITGKSRSSITQVGCYDGVVTPIDAALTNIVDLKSSYMINDQMLLKVRVFNIGITKIDTIVLHWEYKGQPQTPVIWTAGLASGAVDTITLGTISYNTSEIWKIKVYIDNIGSLIDGNQANDTLVGSTFICPGKLKGVFSIGGGLPNNFNTIEEALTALAYCGADSNLTFAFAKGTYSNMNINLTNTANYTNGYTLTLTSLANHADSVIIGTKLTAITLNNSNDIIIKNLTIDASDSTANRYGIRMTGKCSRVLVRDCKINTSENVPVNYTNNVDPIQITIASAAVVEDISIIHNQIKGGYNGIDAAPSTTYATVTRLVIDSNTVTNALNYGISTNTVKSLSYNTVVKSNTLGQSFTAINHNGAGNCTIIGNRIRINDPTSTNWLRGIAISNSTTASTVVVVNNEVIINKNGISSSDVTGIYFSQNYNGAGSTKILFNSVYCTGAQLFKGIWIANYPTLLELKYNNVVVTTPNSFAIYVSYAGTGYLTWDIDHNNMYAPIQGYVITNKSTIEDWQAAILSDKHSFSTLPTYANATSLQQTSYGGFIPLVTPSNVSKDIDGISRGSLTNVGCYHGSFFSVDAALSGIIDLQPNASVGSTDTIRVVVTNFGTTALNTITFKWTINGGVEQTKTWTGVLNYSQKDTISLGPIAYTAFGKVNVKVYFSGLGGLTDEYKSNDTIQTAVITCNNGLQGTYTIGGTDLPTLNDAINAIIHCKANNDVTLKLPAGTYPPVNLTNIANYMNGYTLTLTSVSGNANEVTISGINGIGIACKNSSNIVVKGLTVNMTGTAANTTAINFAGDCDNILVRDCKLIVITPGANSYTYIRPINITGSNNKNIQIIHDSTQGGDYGFYSTGGLNIVYDSNFITNTCDGGVKVESNAMFKSISANYIQARANMSNEWRGMDLSSMYGTVCGNKINAYSSNTAAVYGIYFQSSITTTPMLICNNEIIVKTTGAGSSNMLGTTVPAAIVLGSQSNMVKLLFNSVHYDAGTLTAAVVIQSGVLNMEMKYNNFYVLNATTHAIYNSANYDARWDIDYNNMYAPTNVGYANGASRQTIANWQSVVTSDKHSVKVLPQFTDLYNSLRILDNDSLLVPNSISIDKDIIGHSRYDTTQLGAYTSTPKPMEMALTKVVNTRAVLMQTFDVVVEMNNRGLAPINTARLNWSLNGQIKGSYNWTAPSAISTYGNAEITVGNFVFDGNPATVKVWIEQVNGVPNPISRSDTVTAIITEGPLAWFTEPFVPKTIYQQDFDVYAVILDANGVFDLHPVPKLCIKSTLGTHVDYDTLDMSFADGKWSAHVPTQYYGSTVAYSLYLSDKAGNSILIADSTYINFRTGNPNYNYDNLTLIGLQGLNFGSTDCVPDFTKLTVDVANTGNMPMDFSKNNLNIHFRLTTPMVMNMDTVINTGSLARGEKLTVTLFQQFSIFIASQYDVRVYMENAKDTFKYDDTLIYNYTSGRFPLPIDENFSTQSMYDIFKVVTKTGTVQWLPIPQGTGPDADVIPVFGTGVLAFRGSTGAVATLYTRQLDLSQTVLPQLTFWYFHDTVPARDYTDVRITIDGGATFTSLITVEKQGAKRGWKEYNIPLPSFALNQCVFIVFEAMEWDRNASTRQYIDRILITSRPDLEVADIVVNPPISVCSMKNKTISVVIRTTTNQTIDFSKYPTASLAVEVPGNPTFNYPLQGVILGNTTNTISIPTQFNFIKGMNIVKAYLTTPVDNFNINDTAKLPLNINPALSVAIHPITGGTTNCVAKGLSIKPEVTVKNTGNMDIQELSLVFHVSDDYDILQTIRQTVQVDLHPNDETTIILDSSYTVPSDAYYFVDATVYLTCDSVLANNKMDFLRECVDMKDLSIELIKPAEGTTTATGTVNEIEIVVRNAGDSSYQNVKVTAVFENANGAPISIPKISEVIQNIDRMDTGVYYTFKTKYTAPSSNYCIRVFLDKVDDYQYNDTALRCFSVTGLNTIAFDKFSLGQNIPNPAKQNTRIEYSVPNSGEVVFTVHSVSGQVLYTKTIQSEQGKQFIDLNTNDFAAGVYFYSVEYKGQKLVKRMSVRN